MDRLIDNELLEAAAEHSLVVLGESTRGTAEFYQWRREVSLRLVREHGFQVIALDWDRSDCMKLDAYASGEGEESDRDPWRALHRHYRWPNWVVANTEMVPLVDALRDHNATRLPSQRANLVGLDSFSLYEAFEAVDSHLSRQSPALASQLRRQFTRLEQAGYDRDAVLPALMPAECEGVFEDLQATLVHLYHNREGRWPDALFFHSLLRADADFWELRNQALLRALDDHVVRDQRKVIAWLHNWQIEDLAPRLRQRDAFLVGLGACGGSVTASRRWYEPYETLDLHAPSVDSLEAELSRRFARPSDDILVTRTRRLEAQLRDRTHRGVGVVFDPQATLRRGRGQRRVNLASSYDYYVCFRESHAVEPLHVPYERAQIA